ncbi:hypothetical protein NMY22_g15725 [Coprinellus aureogranulatus]|nr:hypothetical protein NMY22_g15725 [Coprinellus aureogranulatus]
MYIVVTVMVVARAVPLAWTCLNPRPHPPTPASSLTSMATISAQESGVSEKEAPKRPLYESSTQYRNWRFSFERLERTRASMNQAAVAAIRMKIVADEPGSSNDISFLNAEEEVLLVKFYITKMIQLSHFLQFSEEVEATGISYLKRFYLKNTVMDWHPKNVMLTALYLAAKTCNSWIGIEHYVSRIPQLQPSDVLDLEFLVAQSLSFEFAVWHAHRALWGIWLDVQSLPDTPVQLDMSIYNDALKYVQASRLTDAELVYSPAQIALAAFSIASPEIASRWLESKSTPDHSVNAEVIEEIRALIQSQGRPAETEAVREIDRRLKLCKNPEKVPGSRAYIAKKAAEDKKAEERRNKKAATVQMAVEEGDPFGNELKNTQGAPLVDYDDDDDDDD